MAKKRSTDEIEIPKPNEDMRLPGPQTYVTWQGSDWTHISSDRSTPICGATTSTHTTPLVTMDPMGKPRCRECLKAAGIDLLPGEPYPVVKGNPPEAERVAAKTQDLPVPSVVPELKMPPSDFFSSVRQG